MQPVEFSREYVPEHLKAAFREAFLQWSQEPPVAFVTSFYSKDVLRMLLEQVEEDFS